jgi:hypothetical protein
MTYFESTTDTRIDTNTPISGHAGTGTTAGSAQAALDIGP